MAAGSSGSLAPEVSCWRVSYRPTSRAEAVTLGIEATSLDAAASAFVAWRTAGGLDYHSVTFEAGAIVTPLHLHFSPARLDRVVAKMRSLGSPRIRAHFDPASGAWFALEGTHRLRAAVLLGIAPQLVPVGWPRGRRALERARHAVGRAHVFARVDVASPDDPVRCASDRSVSASVAARICPGTAREP